MIPYCVGRQCQRDTGCWDVEVGYKFGVGAYGDCGRPASTTSKTIGANGCIGGTKGARASGFCGGRVNSAGDRGGARLLGDPFGPFILLFIWDLRNVAPPLSVGCAGNWGGYRYLGTSTVVIVVGGMLVFCIGYGVVLL